MGDPNHDAGFVDRERQSRLATTLDPFEQIVALSQEMVNAAFERLHAINPVLSYCNVAASDWGTIKANMRPCRIIIPGKPKEPWVYFQIRFLNGFMNVKMSQGIQNIPVDDWIITLKIPLEPGELHPKPLVGEDEDVSRTRSRHCSLLNKAFSAPALYTVQHLYAVLYDPWWLQNNFELEQSSILVEKEEMAGSKTDQNSDKQVIKSLKQMLSAIVDQWYRGYGDGIGPRPMPNAPSDIFNPPDSPRPVTRVFRRQLYQLGTDYSSPSEGPWDPASRNCLLYCGNPVTTSDGLDDVKHGGIFATIGGNRDPNHRINGSAGLNRASVIGRFCDRYLTPMTVESQIMPKDPSFEDFEWYSKVWFNYTIGPSSLAREDKHSFELSTTSHRYSSSVDGTLPENRHQNALVKQWYSLVNSSGHQTTTFIWTPGTTQLSVECQNKFIVDIKEGKSNEIKVADNANCTYYCYDEISVRWSWKLEIVVSIDGIITWKTTAPLHVETSFTKGPTKGLLSGSNTQDEELKNTMGDEIRRRVQSKIDSIPELGRFEDRGIFEYSEAMFNNAGDLLLQIKYKDSPAIPTFERTMFNPNGVTKSPMDNEDPPKSEPSDWK